MDSDFEKKLGRQKVRPLPAAWREEIMRTAHGSALSGQPSVRESVQPLPLRVALKLWMELFWPARRIWAGLAAMWLLILLANLNFPAGAPQMMATTSPQAADLIMAFREQEQTLAELTGQPQSKAAGTREPQDADRPKTVAPQPRSESLRQWAVA